MCDDDYMVNKGEERININDTSTTVTRTILEESETIPMEIDSIIEASTLNFSIDNNTSSALMFKSTPQPQLPNNSNPTIQNQPTILFNVTEETNPISISKFTQTEVLPQARHTFQKTKMLDFKTLTKALRTAQVTLPNGWSYSISKNQFSILKSNVKTLSIQISLTVFKDNPLPDLKICGKNIPSNHPLIITLPSLTSIQSIYSSLNIINKWSICEGIKDCALKTQFEERDFYKKKGEISFFSRNVHSLKCETVIEKQKRSNLICSNCTKLRQCLNMQLRRKVINKNMEKRHSYMSRGDLQARIKVIKYQNENLKRKFKRLKRKFLGDLKKDGQELNSADADYFKGILLKEKNSLQEGSIAKIFVEQQLSCLKLKNKSRRRWHPKIIQFCLHLKQTSSSAYDILQESGVFELPSKRTLYKYSSHIGSSAGFSGETFKELKEKVAETCKENHQNYFSLMFDEMKIKEDVVYKTNTGELVGYVNLNDIGNEIEEGRFQTVSPKVASHVLQVMIRSITGPLKYTVAYFPCHNMSSDSLHSIISESISKLELNGIRILTVVFDGASTNRKVMKNFCGESCYKWKNTYAQDEERYINFICDPPHLLKTARNCFSNSNWHSKSRYLWKCGSHILWTHLVSLFERDFNRTVKLMPKITNDHINLNSFLRMRVRLASQIFSSTVANALEEEFPGEYPETVKFIRLMNKFFDLTITRNLNEGKFKLNPNLNVYTSVNDSRLAWLENDFINYFKEWDESVDNRPGKFSSAQKNMMKLSRETVEGLFITARSIPETVRFLLRKGASFVLTNRLNQDCLEQEFGKQRRSFGNNEAPNAFQFGQGVDKNKKLGNVIKAPKRGSTLVEKIEPNLKK